MHIRKPLSGNWDVYYVPTANLDPYPPVLEPYLHNPAVTSKIGSMVTWLETNFRVYDQFGLTGDLMRSALPALEEVINADVRTVIYAGDADYIVNYKGVEAMVRAHFLSFFSCPLLSLPTFALTDHVALRCTGRLLEIQVLGKVRETQIQDL